MVEHEPFPDAVAQLAEEVQCLFCRRDGTLELAAHAVSGADQHIAVGQPTPGAALAGYGSRLVAQRERLLLFAQEEQRPAFGRQRHSQVFGGACLPGQMLGSAGALQRAPVVSLIVVGQEKALECPDLRFHVPYCLGRHVHGLQRLDRFVKTRLPAQHLAQAAIEPHLLRQRRGFQSSEVQRFAVIVDGRLRRVTGAGLFGGAAIPLGGAVCIAGQLIVTRDQPGVFGGVVTTLIGEPAGDGPMEVSLPPHEHAFVGDFTQQGMFEGVFLRPRKRRRGLPHDKLAFLQPAQRLL